MHVPQLATYEDALTLITSHQTRWIYNGCGHNLAMGVFGAVLLVTGGLSMENDPRISKIIVWNTAMTSSTHITQTYLR